jgi:hypothetical protein
VILNKKQLEAYRMSEQGISIADLANMKASGGPIAADRRITGPNGIGTNGYQIDTTTYPYGGHPSTLSYSNPNRIAMKKSMSVISAGLRFTIQEIHYFLNKSGAPVDTEVQIIDVFNPDKPDVLEGQKLVLEWTTV